MKVLVTGAAGFLGSHTAERLLLAGMEVTGLDNFSDYYDVAQKRSNAEAVISRGAEIVKMDLRNAEEYQKLDRDFDFIIHFAAQPGISGSSTFEDYYTNNVLATRNLINFALENPDLKHFFFISTSSIYGLEATHPETAVPNPASDYASTKLEGERLILEQSHSGKISTSVLRLFSVYGPRERPEKLYAQLISCGINNQPFKIFEGSEMHLRSFTYVRDIVEGIYRALVRHKTLNGEIMNLGASEEYSTLEGIKLVEELLGREIRLEVIPRRAGDQNRTAANIEKARKLLDYNPSTSLREGLIKQIEWYKQFEDLKIMEFENQLL
ncbi:NAD-dependent epimerase/dehydratase family protein [Salinimicrobium xinjiangense]|uniref:NAD-dependent epimerase/dehydratase family protein n=1 Tax=Salinimicrobium xinjiangense TaxID=438596 RepID=UPI0004040F09|nr:NAD-dependent epimerase/dehydratase family protein [Salinimicrobium xinjiangense]